MVNIRSYLKHANISQSPFTFEFKPYLKNNGIFDYLKNDTEIIYKKGRNIITYKSALDASITIPDDELSLEKMCFIADKRNRNYSGTLKRGKEEKRMKPGKILSLRRGRNDNHKAFGI
jgi:hypothetical protein